jgi:hypothetical protein
VPSSPTAEDVSFRTGRPSQRTISSVREPVGPAVDERTQVVNDQRRERPRNVVGMHRRTQRQGGVGPAIEGKWRLTRNLSD